MTGNAPEALPPPSLRSQVLAHALERLRRTRPSDPSLLSHLSLALRLLAASTSHGAAGDGTSGSSSPINTLPLRIVLHLASSSTNQSSAIPLHLLLSCTLAYSSPFYPAINTLWTSQLDARPEIEDEIRTEIIPALVSRLRLAPSASTLAATSRTLLALSRANEGLLALMLSEADYILPALRESYDALPWTTTTPAQGSGEEENTLVRAKSDTLAFCVEMLRMVQSDGVKQGLRRLMGDQNERSNGAGSVKDGGAEGVSLLGGSLADAVQQAESGIVDEATSGALRNQRDKLAKDDPRVQSILALFPSLPPYLLLKALHHPSLQTTLSGPSSSRHPSPEDQAAPLLEAILSEGSTLPADLAPLKRAIKAMSRAQSTGQPMSNGDIIPSTAPPINSDTNNTTTPANGHASKPITAERRNIFNDDIDFSRLRLKSADPDIISVPEGLGKEIPTHMRENILRLVQRQAEEAEEQARAIAEARGERYVPPREDDGEVAYVDDDAPRGVAGQGDGEESGEEVEGDVLVQRRKNTSQPVVHSYDPEIQTKLELAYLADPTVFDRDGTTRRSSARSKLKERTGMDDSQLEGWKIMLDRNPHKEAILARHTYVPQLNVDYVVSRPASEASSRGSGSGSRGSGNHRGGGGRGRGSGGHSQGGSSRTPSQTPSQRTDSERGGGGGGGDRGPGSRGRGDGGGGGRGSKGSRGHSNVQRTRGHDKKMAKMGAGGA